ncbi:hypothetical protein [Bradyrhizobium sp. ORS 111]|uniref:hypothetical protein n=1 Tax=Bradyrhizobium sp. ORS 111 TaxID=1685958 RepID=UPI00388F78D9
MADIMELKPRRFATVSDGTESVRDGDEVRGYWRATLAGFTAIIAVPMCAIHPAHAHDHRHPELNGWYESLHSGKGPCCDGSDAKRLDDVDWDVKDGHYRVRIDGEWVDVPDEAVVDGPNRAGHTIVWPYYLNGHPKARCFMPGSMG